MCYGGGFGTMPAFAADYFGSKSVGPIYGLMLNAWGCGSAIGPLLIAHLRQASGFLHEWSAYHRGHHGCIHAVPDPGFSAESQELIPTRRWCILL